MTKTTLSDIRLLVRENRQEHHTRPSTGTHHAPDVQTEPDSGLLPPTVFSPDTASYGRLFPEYLRPLPRPFTISPETEQALMAVEGAFTIRELSDKYGIPAQTLYRWARKNHYNYKSGIPHSPLSPKTEQEIRASLPTMSTAQLSKAYGIPYYSLYHWMKKRGLTAKKTSEFPAVLQKELLKKCRTDSLKTLAQEFGLSQQVMRSRLQSMGCFSDGKGGFLIIEGHMDQEILACCMEKGLAETAKEFHTTVTAVKSFLRKNRWKYN